MLIKWRDILQFSAYKPSTEHSLITVTSPRYEDSFLLCLSILSV